MPADCPSIMQQRANLAVSEKPQIFHIHKILTNFEKYVYLTTILEIKWLPKKRVRILIVFWLVLEKK